MNTILVVTQPYIRLSIDINMELISKANELSEDNHATVLVLVMEGVLKETLQAYSRYGGDEFLICEVETQKDFIYYSNIVVQACKEFQPDLVMYPGTDLGKAISATVAVDLGAALVADCIDIQVLENGEYCFTRAAMNSCIIAQIRCMKDCIQMCTIKKNTFPLKELVKEKQIVIHNIPLLQDETGEVTVRTIQSTIEEAVQKSRIEDANVIFGVGRGVLPQDIPLVEQIAKYYKAEVGCSRYYVEEKVMDKSQQIGQSGNCVSPDIYIALGISGASQHMVGLKNAKKIIAINNDENAAIMKYADYIVIANTHETIHAMYSKMLGE